MPWKKRGWAAFKGSSKARDGICRGDCLDMESAHEQGTGRRRHTKDAEGSGNMLVNDTSRAKQEDVDVRGKVRRYGGSNRDAARQNWLARGGRQRRWEDGREGRRLCGGAVDTPTCMEEQADEEAVL